MRLAARQRGERRRGRGRAKRAWARNIDLDYHPQVPKPSGLRSCASEKRPRRNFTAKVSRVKLVLGRACAVERAARSTARRSVERGRRQSVHGRGKKKKLMEDERERGMGGF